MTDLKDLPKVSKNQFHRSPIRAIIWDKTGGKCWYCGLQTNPFKSFTIDHVDGRSPDISNLVPCCKSCNTRKRSMTVDQFREKFVNGKYITQQAMKVLREFNIIAINKHKFWFEKR